jgi:hypothetical protein
MRGKDGQVKADQYACCREHHSEDEHQFHGRIRTTRKNAKWTARPSLPQEALEAQRQMQHAIEREQTPCAC